MASTILLNVDHPPSAREAGRRAELEALEVEHKKRRAAQAKLHAAQVRRQKEFLRSIGVPDLSPEEITERAQRRAASGPSGTLAEGRRRTLAESDPA